MAGGVPGTGPETVERQSFPICGVKVQPLPTDLAKGKAGVCRQWLWNEPSRVWLDDIPALTVLKPSPKVIFMDHTLLEDMH